jgi:hypothetical protein
MNGKERIYTLTGKPNCMTAKKKALQNARLFLSAPLIDERCNYIAMIEYVTIRKLKG